MTTDEFHYIARAVCFSLCLLAFAYRLPGAFTPRRNPAVLALLVCFAAESVGWGLCFPSAASWFDWTLNTPTLSTLVLQVEGAAVFSPALLIAVSYWAKPKREAQRRVLLIAVIAVLVAVTMSWLWAISPAEQQPHYAGQDLHDPIGIAYTLVYEISFAAGLVSLVVLMLRHAADTDEPWLRRGLYIVVVGSACYVLVAGERLVSVTATLAGYDTQGWGSIGSYASYPGLIGVITGLILPSLVPDLRGLRQWSVDYRTYQRLYDLWSALCVHFPAISLIPGRRRNQILFPGDLHYVLHRQLVEIRDGWRALRPYLPTNPPIQGNEAVVAAWQIRSAIDRKKRGVPPENNPSASPLERLDMSDHRQELAWLCQVADAYSRLSRTPESASGRETQGISS